MENEIFDIFSRLRIWIEELTEWLNSWLTPILRDLLGPLDRFLAELSPNVGRVCAVTFFIIAAIWAVRLKKEYVYLGAPDTAPWRDLRIWTVVFLVPYVVIYAFLF